MRCPRCDGLPTSVLKTERPIDKHVYGVKQRRRRCRTCQHDFYSYEVGEDEFAALQKLVQENGPIRRSLRTKNLNEKKP